MSDANPMAWLPFSIAEAALTGQGGGEGELARAWPHLLERLKAAGELVVSSEVNRNSVDYASGMRHLMVLLAVGIDEALRTDPDPVLAVTRTSTDDILTWGMECPDCIYLRATLRGGETYRLFGNRGTARYVGLQTMNGIVSTTNCLVDDLEMDADGNFEVTLSAAEHEGNWMRLEGDHPTLVVRHFFYDWDNEKPSSLQIERIGDEVEPKDPSVAADVAVSRQIHALGEFVHDNLKFFLDFNAGPPANGFMPPIDRSDMGAAAENRPVIGRYELEPDEALILEVEPPEGVYWSYSLGNPWWETIHYGRHQSSLNAHQATVDSDGILRVVVSSRDPGVANWLDTAGHSNGAMILRCVWTETAPTPSARVVKFADVASELPAGTATVSPAQRAAILAARRSREVLQMTFSADELEEGAQIATGLDDFGSPYYREGLERTVDALNNEADLNETGRVIQHATISNALIQRLRIVDTYQQHPEIDEEVVGGPVFVIGLPRTGTTALSQLVANDPQFRSLRLWESQACTPPPEAATQHDDPRIAQAAEGIAMMDSMFPRMRTMMNSEPQAPTECQDLMGMSFRTFHFDGVVRVPGYLAWLMQCDMRETYTFHRQVLKLLQWRCPPTLWHLKTPVHMFSLDALVAAYPNAKFLWSHRDPAKVLASVCSLIQYVRSWSSDRDDPHELGVEQLECWTEGVRRAMDFRNRFGDNRFADVSFADLNADPIGTLEKSYGRLDLTFTDEARRSVQQWADEHRPGSRGEHNYDLADYGLTRQQVHESFADYLAAYDATA